MIEFNLNELQKFFAKMQTAGHGNFRRDLELFLMGIGTEFLRIVEDEIIRLKVMDTRLLLASFHEGGDGGVWKTSGGGLTLEVGTNVEYAAYVNNGHWTNRQGVEVRFVPGRWQGDRFIYEKGAKTGMVLKQHWVEGAYYWESAIRILENMLPGFVDAKLQDWVNAYFGTA